MLLLNSNCEAPEGLPGELILCASFPMPKRRGLWTGFGQRGSFLNVDMIHWLPASVELQYHPFLSVSIDCPPHIFSVLAPCVFRLVIPRPGNIVNNFFHIFYNT
jgi:hypothetical protein